MTERSVEPKDCALAFALPLTVDELSTDNNPGVPRDFARELSPDRYEPVASLAQSVVEEAEALKVKVKPRATLADVHALLGERRVVTVFAHARMVEISPTDVCNPMTFLDRVRSGQNPLLLYLAQNLRKSLAFVDEARPRAPDSKILQRLVAEELNQVIAPTHAYLARTPTQMYVGENRASSAPLISRTHLEETFPLELRSAPSVEFFDGMRTVAEVVAAVPQGFAGVIDLVICNGVVLGQAIKRHHPQCRVLANEMQAPIAFRLGLYRYTLREIARANGELSYTDATLRVRKAIMRDLS